MASRNRLAFCLLMFTVACLMSPAGLGAQQPAVPPSAAEQEASRLLQASDWPGAITAFRDLVAREGANPRAWFGLGAALHETGTYPDALTAFLEAAARGYQQTNQLHFRLARTYSRLGDSGKAFGELDKLASAGFANESLLQTSPDLATLRAVPRFAAIAQRVSRNARPCEFDPGFRKFDFWIGDWDVQQTGVPRASSGASSKIERVLDGCVILENWTPPSGPSGKSFNIYNTSTKKWEQYWVDASGRITHYFGEFRDDGNLYYEADQFGSSSRIRMTFFNQGPDQVRQLGHLSTDGGKTWQVSFDLTYVRKK